MTDIAQTQLQPQPKLELISRTAEGEEWCFHCPGCGYGHWFRTNAEGVTRRPAWQWNGDIEKPTVTPSILVSVSKPSARCHLFITSGKIQFLEDCFHHLAGQTVPLEPID